MRIAIFGAGGVGGYFGTRWCEAGLDVAFVARGAHLAALQEDGLRLESPLGDRVLAVEASDDPARIGPVDLVVMATKAGQLADAAGVAGPLLGPDTAVLGLQNGVEAVEILQRALGAERVLGGTCRIISFVVGPGHIRHMGVAPTLSFGEPSGGSSERSEAIAEALASAAGVTVRRSDDIEAEIWKKFLFFAPVSGLGAVTRASIGGLRAVPEVRTLLRRAMEEVAALARARGVRLDDEAVARSMAFFETLPGDGTSSLQRDIAAGRPSELESLSGAMVRLGRAAGVETPVHDFLYAALLPAELAART